MLLHSIPQTLSTRLWFVAAALLVAALTVAAYVPGLHGPFLLDDIGNLEPLKRWLDGSLDLRGVIFDNRSGPTGRPLSMATFAFDAWRTGEMDSFTFKPTNLIIHLCCGSLLGILVFQILGCSGSRASNRQWTALVAAALWLWLPIQVSTVLYVVQRMAQLAALGTLMTLVVYIHARQQLQIKTSKQALAWLWIGVPLAALCAVSGKENGVLAIPLAAAAEWTLFRGSYRPRNILVFFTVTAAIPALLVLCYLLTHPTYFSHGYTVRDFTLTQRLLTEPRILWDYLRVSFFPVGALMGIYHDNFPASTSLWSPLTTIVSIVAWAIAIVLAIGCRRVAPVFSFGVLAYLASHLLESGPIALELYFEHRNYLPSAFAIIALVGLISVTSVRFAVTGHFRVIARGAVIAALGLYCLGSWNHASAWSDGTRFYAMQYAYNPTSPRLLSILTARSMLAKDLPAALATIDAGEAAGPVSERVTATLWRLLAYCEVGGVAVPDPLYHELETRAHGRVTQYAMNAWDLLADRVDRGCPEIDVRRVARSGLRWIDEPDHPDRTQEIWRTRYNLARLLADAGDLESASIVGEKAWRDSALNNGVGVFLFRVYASLNEIGACRRILTILEQSYGGADRDLNGAIRVFRSALSGHQDSAKQLEH